MGRCQCKRLFPALTSRHLHVSYYPSRYYEAETDALFLEV